MKRTLLLLLCLGVAQYVMFVAHQVQGACVQDRQSEENNPTGRSRRQGGFGGQIELGPDDGQLYADPPNSIVMKRDSIERGKLEMIEYESKTVGTTRKMNVYTPPGYTTNHRYPVLYLLHGIGGDETEWQRFTSIDKLFDNLIADRHVVPMIVVMPNGRAQENDRAEGNVFAAAPAFEKFERDLLDDVIPVIESRYSVLADRKHRALAGLSMGGGQSLNFGLAHLDQFAWVGGFSSAPNTKEPDVLIPEPDKVKQQLQLLWLSCGNQDGLIRISQRLQRFLKANDISHVWNVDSHGHDATHWRNNLYYFAQLLFREGFDGPWFAKFDTAVGVQEYRLNLILNDQQPTATAVVESQEEERHVEFTDVEVDKESISFVEVRSIGDRDIRIEYNGKLIDGKLQLVREVGDFGSAKTIATRFPTAQREVPEPEAEPQPERMDRESENVLLANYGKRDISVHDPSSIVKDGDEYWMFATGNLVKSWRSRDLVEWKPGPAVFDTMPAWVKELVPDQRGHFWAPDIVQVDDRYLLYYSVSSFGKNTSAIALASNSTLDPDHESYAWKDEGIVVQTDRTDNFNAIDPAVIKTSTGELWMAFGSYWSGLKLIRLDPSSGLRSKDDDQVYALAANEDIEAAHIFEHEGWYYLFINWGKCCRGVRSTYNIRVGRSEQITGPYLDQEGKPLMERGGSLLLETDGPFIGPGHANVLHQGNEFIFHCHFYDGTNRGRSKLAIMNLTWDGDGWPNIQGPYSETHAEGSNQ